LIIFEGRSGILKERSGTL